MWVHKYINYVSSGWASFISKLLLHKTLIASKRSNRAVGSLTATALIKCWKRHQGQVWTRLQDEEHSLLSQACRAAHHQETPDKPSLKDNPQRKLAYNLQRVTIISVKGRRNSKTDWRRLKGHTNYRQGLLLVDSNVIDVRSCQGLSSDRMGDCFVCRMILSRV